MTATAEGVPLWDADTKVVETSVITAGKVVDGVVMMCWVVIGIGGTVGVVVVVELELLGVLVLEGVVEEVELVLDDDEEVVVGVVVGGVGTGGNDGVVVEVDVGVLEVDGEEL